MDNDIDILQLDQFSEEEVNRIINSKVNNKFTYTKDQLIALYKLMRWYYSEHEYKGSPQVFKLSGYGGTGKSTLISAFTDIIELDPSSFVYCAFTGKAVNVLRSKGVQAVTIHHLIYNVREDDNGDPIFTKKDKDEVDYELLIIDEYSMIGSKLYEDILSYGIRIILVGDPGQLMPVLDKSINTGNSDVTLYEITRQAEGSPIIKLATKVRCGTSIGFGALSDKVAVIKRDASSYTVPIDILSSGHFQILCGYNKTRSTINRLVRYHKYGNNVSNYPVPGDRLICTANDWQFMISESICLTNGIMGTVISVRMPEDIIDKLTNDGDIDSDDMDPLGRYDIDTRMWTFNAVIQFDGIDEPVVVNINRCCFDSKYKDLVEDGIGHWFDYSYAITVHKAQGSEWDNVILYYEPVGDYMKWLYTGITRAKESLLLIMD